VEDLGLLVIDPERGMPVRGHGTRVPRA
jgi:hypothetical protein